MTEPAVFRFESPSGFVDPATCDHDGTQPVYAYLHGPNPQVGDAVVLVNDGKPVSRICTHCLAQLHAGWGCTDCEWQQIGIRRLCEVTPSIEHALVRPCKEHA